MSGGGSRGYHHKKHRAEPITQEEIDQLVAESTLLLDPRPEGTFPEVTEELVGISSFISSHRGFRGIFKQR